MLRRRVAHCASAVSALIITSLATTACGSTGVNTDQPPASRPPTPATRSTPVTVVSSSPTTVAAAPPSTLSIEPFEADGSICERVFAAEFSDERLKLFSWSDGHVLTVHADDYDDSTEATCEIGKIRAVEDPNGNFPVIELADAGGGVSANLRGYGEIEVTDVVSWQEGLRWETLDADLAEARDLGVTLVDTLLRADADSFELFLQSEVVWLNEVELIERDAAMDNLARQGFPSGYTFNGATIADYYVNHEPQVRRVAEMDLSPELRSLLSATAGAGEVVSFSGDRERPGRELYLGTDLMDFFLVRTSDGWRVLGL